MRSFDNLRLQLPTAILVILSTLAIPSRAFTFRFTSPPSQCSATSIIWDGGTAPFSILLVPVGFMPQGQEKRVIYDRTVTSGNKHGFNFPFPANTRSESVFPFLVKHADLLCAYRFVAVMSDATGFGTGGTSPIITIGSSNTSSCLPTTPSTPQFFLYLSPTTPTQCSPITISWDTPRGPPVTVYGIIPQGKSFDLNAPSHTNGGTSFDWTVNVRSGTPFFFVAGDGNGRGTGGSSDVANVKSGASGCINDSSPSATADAGVGSVGPLPNGVGNGVDSTVISVATATATIGSGSNGETGGNNTGENGGNGNGSGGSDDGSGGGTVHGPLDPTSIAGAAKYVAVLLCVLLLA